jgi:glycosyltransferase involved in cell wall biosynthesis
VYVPNQFWVHKNHLRLLEAIALLKQQGVSITAVCTGSPTDYRSPDHFAHVWQSISRMNIHDNIVYLGLVPAEDVLALIRQSVCVVNPSLFEGWGYSVEEARSVGKRVLISDLPVHREHHAPQATYFDPHDADDLADKLAHIWIEAPGGPDYLLEQQARTGNMPRMQAYGSAFLDVVREAVATVQPDRFA